VLLVFDITTEESFEHVEEWYKEISDNAGKDVLVYLVGNFCDMVDDREVSQERAIALMKKLNFHHYVETSAVTGTNIAPLFETVTKHLFYLNEKNI